ncbi:MAG: rod shape-determining protein RodA [Bacteroidetes bacterium]|jgi:rod shape determining protein RodA|nr:rod shape-determining protein RodA [Bacteroidota bacterium]
MSKNVSLKYSLDWTTVFYYVVLVFMGWISIYGASYDLDQTSIFDWEQRAGKQFVWILTAFGLAGMLLLVDYKMYNFFAYFIYIFTIFLLIVTIFIAPDIKGSRSWLVLGPVSFQPAELAKMATSLALARFMSSYNYKLKNWKDLLPLAMFIALPFALIILQKETGSALVFAAFLLMLYREGMNGIVLLLGVFAVILFVIVIRFSVVPVFDNQGSLGFLVAMGIIMLMQFIYAFFFARHRKEAGYMIAGVALVTAVSLLINVWFVIDFEILSLLMVVATCVYWVFVELFTRFKKYWMIIAISLGSAAFCFFADYFFNNVLEPHQQIRIKVLLNMEDDPTGAGYNVNQSKIAIGSGGFWGKGFLNGTQTKLKYVPEQDTDFIFCTVGEEHGFWGSTLVLVFYWLLLMRLLRIAERQRETFNRVYAYCVASIFFFHLMVNIGMVLGIMPVIGIPLPFFSYGGSSLWGFTILLFILLRLDASRVERMR